MSSRAYAYLRAHRGSMLEDLRTFVVHETPSEDKSALDSFAEFLARFAADLGGSVELIRAKEAGDHVMVRWGSGSSPPVLLLGHYDTVWPAGSLARMPFRAENGLARGPGVLDMKCGLVQGFWAVRALQNTGDHGRDVAFLITSDEEVGSGSSRKVTESQARAATAVLVLEPAFNGALKTERKGVSRYRIVVNGRAAHAGLSPSDGINAIDALCEVLAQTRALAASVSGVTLNVGTISGGTQPNVVPANAAATIDVRSSTNRAATEFDRRLRSVCRSRIGHVELSGGVTHPPVAPSRTTQALFEVASAGAREIGFSLDQASVGGGSDGSFCAAIGARVLDGLGAVGWGPHAEDECVDVGTVAERAALVAYLLREL
jgi:glutamate carboxypeptidase